MIKNSSSMMSNIQSIIQEQFKQTSLVEECQSTS